MLRKLKSFLFRLKLNKLLKAHTVKHEVMNLGRAKQIGILFDGANYENFQIVDDYAMRLEKQKKKVKLLAFIDAAKVSEGLEFPFFLRRDTTWLYAPKGHLPLDFTREEFDILINASLSEYEPLEYITTFSNARYRVGPYFEDKTHCFDLMINNEEDTLAAFLNKVNHYLGIIDNQQQANAS